jgi:hypothetical protein
VSEYAELSALQNEQHLEEVNIFLALKNPTPDVLTVQWEIDFPFSVALDAKKSGKARLDPHGNEHFSWETALSPLSKPQRDAAADQEIVVNLTLSNGIFFTTP